jgi:maltose/maltodextrin transport system permease protein
MTPPNASSNNDNPQPQLETPASSAARPEAQIPMSAVNVPAEMPGRAVPKLSIPKLPAAMRWGLWLLCNAFALYLIIALYAQGQTVFALLGLVVAGIASFVFINRRAYAHRYIFPAVAGMLVFVIFPLLYTVGIGFTNYSGTNLLNFEQAQRYHLNQTYLAGERFGFSLHQNDAGEMRLRVDRGEQGVWVSAPLAGEPVEGEPLGMSREAEVENLGAALPLRDVIRQRKQLERWVMRGHEGQLLRLYGLREVAAVEPLYRLRDDGSLVNNQTGERLTANDEIGFYVDAEGQKVAPGYTVYAGWSNFAKVLTDPKIRGPFLQIFVWTVCFAALTVVFTLAVGLVLASLLQWEMVRGKAFYRLMLILPYAVPAFISILVFKGLFNQSFGEINLMLDSLFGVRPDWFSDPTLARSMILMVNTWLGYPYMLLLCMGLLQAIPRDLYEASAMDGATPVDNLLKITLPLLIKPLAPLLIASFAFNFNNFVLITLLTRGGPDILGTTTPAGTTDLLVSYTYRIAFQDSGQNFALAAAIATLIFIVVGAMAWLNLKLSKVKV